MAQHSNYWSCTPFADRIRGTKKLSAGTAEEWDDWTTAAKMKHNFRYWLAEELLDNIQDFVTWPVRKIYDIKYYINNRWVTRSHALTAHARDIKPGQWQDVGNRFLPCLFNELVDFVEIESAWSHIAWGDKEARAKYDPPFWASGLEHLDWAMTLSNEEWLEEDKKSEAVPTSQAVAAKEIKELYIWWTVTYRARPDPYDASGWTEYCEKSREFNGGKLFGGKKTPELEQMSDKSHTLLQEIEAAYEQEDEAMMIRLIRARGSLWT
jgi:hypothetical protein